MRKKTIRGLVVSLMLVLVSSTTALADEMNMGKAISKSVDGITAELSFKDEEAKTGKDQIMITLHDSNDKEIDNADVTIIAKMPQDDSMKMDSNKPITIKLEKSEKGQYMGDINFTDKGKWTVTADITVQGEKKSMDFDVNVVSGGPNWIIIGGFLGAIVLIIVVAAIKKKQAK
ncbi:hypothetical protein CFOLD11_43830 [Clostridium folliculivorans]|uniref:YtkA-like domain-containing protein n=1 Tax=Clostridium folliculivorans TaxID=2886038 RepID=A0A9W6DD35_9CLOT|nr:FixH family protein [Clostridium folliculivorans]GKU27556.1 hypothetical protein CFOLD11_43830 [Clostridium folliculivorans]